MGCDIHMYIEKSRNGNWVPAQGFVEVDDNHVDVPWMDRFSDRDYLLFGLLAGVRDSTNQKFEPKGFPIDASPEVRRAYERYGVDAHTPSYLTLAELQSIDWDNEMVTIGRLFPEDKLNAFKVSVKDGKPNYGIIQSWCSWTNQEGWKYEEIQVPIKYQFSRFHEFMRRLHYYDWRCKPEEIRIVFWFDN